VADNYPTINFRMSKAGTCQRAIVAEYLHYDAPELPAFVQEAAEEGKVHEELVKAKLRAKGYVISNEQDEVFCGNGDYSLTGHIDGKIMAANMPLSLLEVKSMSQFEFDRWQKGRFEAFPQYYDQMTLYLQYTGLQQCLYAVKNRSSGYLDISIYQRDNNHYHNVIALDLKFASIVDHIDGKKLPTAIWDSNSIQCKRCPYSYLCEVSTVYTEQDKEMLDNAVDIWRHGKKLVEDGTRLVDESRSTFENQMQFTNTKKLLYNGLSMQLIDKSTQTYDKKKLLEIFKADDLIPALKEKKWTELRIEDTDER
jgi:hypothetical protein